MDGRSLELVQGEIERMSPVSGVKVVWCFLDNAELGFRVLGLQAVQNLVLSTVPSWRIL